MKLSKGSDQSYDLNCSQNETKEGSLRHFLGVAFGTQSETGPLTLISHKSCCSSCCWCQWAGFIMLLSDFILFDLLAGSVN
jgi:hypothetical protein